MTDPGRRYFVEVVLHIRAETVADRKPDDPFVQQAAEILGPGPALVASFEEAGPVTRAELMGLRDSIQRALDDARP